MLKCIVNYSSFYGGKRLKKGDHILFDGAAKDLPKHFSKIASVTQGKPAEKIREK